MRKMKTTNHNSGFIGNLKNMKTKFTQYLMPNSMMRKCREIIQQGDLKTAKVALEQTWKYHHKNLELNYLLIEVNIAMNEWKEVEVYFNRVFNDKPDEIPLSLYMKIAQYYQNTDETQKYEDVIKTAVVYHRNNLDLIENYIEILISKKEWSTLKNQFELIPNVIIQKLSDRNLIKFGMIYKVLGNHEYGNALLQKGIDTLQDTEQDESPHKKLTLYDNGESRIEYYKRISYTNKVMITFDSINMDWQGPSFSYKLLARQNVDIIAIRKRKKQTYQQDLTQETFVETLKDLVDGYEDKVSYGYSLGAYNALYFASLLDCRILAISPRLSIHPEYGRQPFINKERFNQNKSLPFNADLSPIIVFDPYNDVDNKYVTQGVLSAFPHAILLKVKYGGHGMAPHLLNIGQLKEFILQVIDNKVPIYNPKLRTKSSIYYRLLASRCLKHKKHAWALDLINHSLKMLPTDKTGVKLKLKILKEANNYQEAHEYLLELIKEYPERISFGNLLIDFYIENENVESAYAALAYSLEKFGTLPSIVKRQEKLKKHFETRGDI